MQSQQFTATRQCRCVQRPMKARQLRHATKLSLRNKPVAFACHSQAPSRLPETTSHTEFFPKQAQEVKEQAALDFMSRLQRSTIDAASLTCPVETAYLGPSEYGSQHQDQAPVLLLHGFDSSSLEFRRLLPLLERSLEAWAVDLVGWGFSDSGAASQSNMKLGPKQKRDHLYAFWKEKIKRPMIVVGTSLGGAIAMDFALEYPDAVKKLVLVDAQGFIDGLGPWRVAPKFLINLLVQVLKSTAIRKYAGDLAYNDKALATDDALLIGRLHTYLSGWAEANVAFIQSGGYSLSKRIPLVQQECLVVWGRNDKILKPDYAEQFSQVLPKSKLVWVENCGHCPHLEQPQALADCIVDFALSAKAEQVPSSY
ncbi:TPA: hypothetical protein ACH3X3_007456 [Trebouxia sp. C0006]